MGLPLQGIPFLQVSEHTHIALEMGDQVISISSNQKISFISSLLPDVAVDIFRLVNEKRNLGVCSVTDATPSPPAWGPVSSGECKVCTKNSMRLADLNATTHAASLPEPKSLGYFGAARVCDEEKERQLQQPMVREHPPAKFRDYRKGFRIQRPQPCTGVVATRSSKV